MGIAYFGLVVVIVSLLALYAKSWEDEAERIARERAQRQSQVATCYQQIDRASQTISALEALVTLAEVQILNVQTAERFSDTDDPLRRARQISIIRLRAARDSIQQLVDTFVNTVPSLKSCRDLAETLDVDQKPYEKSLRR
jgi:hypothetical protein